MPRKKKQEQQDPASATVDTLANLMSPGGNHIAKFFECMGIAETAIADRLAKCTDERVKHRYLTAFALLCPPASFQGLDTRVYESFCNEMLDRVKTGKQPLYKLLTKAEAMIALSQASQLSPLNSAATGAYLVLYEHVFGASAVESICPKAEMRVHRTSPKVIEMLDSLAQMECSPKEYSEDSVRLKKAKKK